MAATVPDMRQIGLRLPILAHMIEARISRWLLRCRDLPLSDDIPPTHEFLREMVGVQRTSVSIVAIRCGEPDPLPARTHPGA